MNATPPLSDDELARYARHIVLHEVGGPEVLQLVEIDRPIPAAGEVRIRVAASAFNAADNGMRAGFLPIPVQLPHVPGYDVSGTVDAVGDGPSWAAVHRDAMRAVVTEHGAVLVRGLGLRDAAEVISPNPVALQLRYLQTLTEVGVNPSSTVVFPLPLDVIRPFLENARATPAETSDRPLPEQRDLPDASRDIDVRAGARPG